MCATSLRLDRGVVFQGQLDWEKEAAQQKRWHGGNGNRFFQSLLMIRLLSKTNIDKLSAAKRNPWQQTATMPTFQPGPHVSC